MNKTKKMNVNDLEEIKSMILDHERHDDVIESIDGLISQVNESTIQEIEELKKLIDNQIEQVLHSEDDTSIPGLYMSILDDFLLVSSEYQQYLRGESTK